MQGAPCILWLFQNVPEQRRSELNRADAIEEAMKDADWLSRSILDKQATMRRPMAQSATADLSPRDREVLELICDGLHDAASARLLVLSKYGAQPRGSALRQDRRELPQRGGVVGPRARR